MKASEAKLLEFLQNAPQLIIPIYQRTYSWTERECRQLWEDIIRVGSNDAVSGHFVGSIVYIESGLSNVTLKSPLLVIDGQQRLTTISLILEALARNLRPEEPEPVDGFSAKKLRRYYLLNDLEEGDRAFKMLLTQTDRASLLALVQQQDLPAEHSLRIEENFAFFSDQVKKIGKDLSALCLGLAKLIRNFILMGLPPDQQTRLYTYHWHPMEVAFGQEAYGQQFDSFMRHYLTVKTGSIPKVGEVYEAFRTYSRESSSEGRDVEALVADIQRFAGYYCAMALGKEPSKKLDAAFQDLRELTVNVAYPFLLELYDDYASGTLSEADFARILRLVEAYVFRRAVCAIPTNSLNKTFATISKSIDKNSYVESIEAYLLGLTWYRSFPTDEDFKQNLMSRDLYNFPRRSYFLRRLENHGSKEYAEVNNYTIEHILPQNQNLSPTWQAALGPEWKEIQHTWLHTLGNLTLTGYNSEYSDHSFAQKRNMAGGFKESPLRLNAGLGMLETWNEASIRERAERLAVIATKAWPAPELAPDVIERYKTKAEKTAGYALEDHSYLANNSLMRPLFEAFRTEVLALDPSVTEEVLKLYIAYKAETNFVDVVPQVRRLRLTLNLRFHEVHDPEGMCVDVANLGHWGNGDVEVSLSSLGELPYIIGLVRQSFEKQMGDYEANA